MSRVEQVRQVVARLRASRVGRALERYSTARGSLLAGGIAYTGLVSLFAALAIGVSVLMATMGRHDTVRAAVLRTLDRMLPGVVAHGSTEGLVSIDQLTLDSAVNLGSVVGALMLVYAAMGLMGALRNGIRAMFGIVTVPVGAVRGQLINLAGFVAVMVAVVATAAASLGAGVLGAVLRELPGPASAVAGPGVVVASVAGSFLVDAVAVAGLVRLSGPRVPRRDMVRGAGLAALALGVLRLAGTGVMGGSVSNPVLAPFAALATVVVWLHLSVRVLLVVCAWMSNPPAPHQIEHPDEVHAHECPNYVTLSAPHTLTWPRQALTGTVDVDAAATAAAAATGDTGAANDADPPPTSLP